MKTGRVKFFSIEKGYGFITIDKGEGDIFVPISEVTETIEERDRVSFEIVEEKRVKKAVNVKRLLKIKKPATPLE